MLMKPSLVFEMSTAACLVKEEAPERSGWFRGSTKKNNKRYRGDTLNSSTSLNTKLDVIFLSVFL